ncbi:MAG: glycoside hydrolase family 3 C-terminal domain-containing protein [Lachnospiraceae bacterium]|jgi:beta-glucosidase
MKKVQIFKGLTALSAFLLAVATAGTTLSFQYDENINRALGINTTVTSGADGATLLYENDYGYDKNALIDVYRDAASAIQQIGEESAVLLKNDDGALPLAHDAKIAIFGKAATDSVIYSTTTDSRMTAMTFIEAMQDEFGADNVYDAATVESSGDSGGFGPGMGTGVTSGDGSSAGLENSLDTYTAKESEFSEYGDAAVVVFGRQTGEGSDLYQYSQDETYDDGSPRRYLDLSAEEEDLISYLKDEKDKGVFDRIIVLIAGDFSIEMNFLEEYDVDAAVWAGSEGAYGVNGLVNVLSGDVNPSGRLVDTIAANSTSAPASVYAGHEGTLSYTNAQDVIDANPLVNSSDGDQIIWYNIYAEGIYVGYKYYETRYEDTVLGQGSASGEAGSSTGSGWNYADEVNYPFGYGSSYTTFTEELQDVTFDEEDDSYTVTVKVTNTGDVSGKDVVEVYAQTPYGDYEKENLVEKASVSLMGFAKTQELAAGDSETVTVSVPRYFLASYDQYAAKGYILSSGDYYLSVGKNAHDALNNILAAKGYSSADGMTAVGNNNESADGSADNVYTWNQAELHTDSYKNSPYTGVEVTNQFDFTDLNYYSDDSVTYDFTYMTRSDWEGTFPEQVQLTASDAIISSVSNYGDTVVTIPEDQPDYDSFTQGADNGIVLSDMIGVDFDDDETWDKFLDEFTIEEMANLITDNMNVQAVDRLGVAGMRRTDDDYQAGGSVRWPSHPTTTRTWNTELVAKRGELEGVTMQLNDYDEVWWGSANMHRTPFLGRTGQYYSEDANLDYLVGYVEAQAVQEVGGTLCAKHFTTNDQETHRQGLTSFMTEQALREIYLRAFEGGFQGSAMSTMNALNRQGTMLAKNNYAMNITVLREEWGFEGHVTSDGYVDLGYFNNAVEEIVSGMDYSCCDSNGNTAKILLEELTEDTGSEYYHSGYVLQALRRAAKDNLNVMLHGWRMNSLSGDVTITHIVPTWEKALMGVDLALAILTILFLILAILKNPEKYRSFRKVEAKTAKTMNADAADMPKAAETSEAVKTQDAPRNGGAAKSGGPAETAGEAEKADIVKKNKNAKDN